MDVLTTERMDVFRDFARFGLEHWGSDARGVETTRRFMLEWMSYTHRYVPVGLLESGVAQAMHLRPAPYRGRNDLESLLASDETEDWMRVAAMFLGPAGENFRFVPKHRSNSYSGESAEALRAMGGGGRRRSRRTGEGARGCVVRTSERATKDQGGRCEHSAIVSGQMPRVKNDRTHFIVVRPRTSSRRKGTSRPSRRVRAHSLSRRSMQTEGEAPTPTVVRTSCAEASKKSLACASAPSSSPTRARTPRAIAPRPGATSVWAPLTAPLLRRRGRARREQGEDVRRAFQGVQGVSQGGARGNRPEAEGRTREALLKTRGGRGWRTTYIPMGA